MQKQRAGDQLSNPLVDFTIAYELDVTELGINSQTPW